jgi:hypothetical protein
MAFEFLRGKIDIVLEKFSFSPGETIKGKVLIDLKKPTRARQLKIGFYGLRIIKERITDARGNPMIRTRREFIHKFEMPLDGEKEYQKGEYQFEIKIPQDIKVEKKPKEGILGTIFKAAEVLSQASGMTSRTEWYLETVLEIPMAFDMKKRASINIV